MRRLVVRCFMAALLISAGFGALAPMVQAQGTPPDPTPVVVVGNTRFAPLFESVTLGPGEVIERGLDVSAFSRLSILAAAVSGPNDGRVVVRTLFAAPRVPVRNRIDLSFNGRRIARDSALMPVRGPRFLVEIGNRSRQPVEVSLSVFATK